MAGGLLQIVAFGSGTFSHDQRRGGHVASTLNSAGRADWKWKKGLRFAAAPFSLLRRRAVSRSGRLAQILQQTSEFGRAPE